MFCHHRSYRHRDRCGESPLLKVLAVGAIVYAGLKAIDHWHHYHRD